MPVNKSLERVQHHNLSMLGGSNDPTAKFVDRPYMSRSTLLKQPSLQKIKPSVSMGNDIKHVFTFSTEDVTRENHQTIAVNDNIIGPPKTLKFFQESSEISRDLVPSIKKPKLQKVFRPVLEYNVELRPNKIVPEKVNLSEYLAKKLE